MAASDDACRSLVAGYSDRSQLIATLEMGEYMVAIGSYARRGEAAVRFRASVHPQQ